MPLALCFVCGVAAAGGSGSVLEVVDAEGAVIATFPVQADTQWCLAWNHSVAGFTVRDCFALRGSVMVLDSSFQPDFAAGLGHFEGRGTMRTDPAGGYRIEGIDEPVPQNRLHLRVGSAAVDHRIEFGHEQVSLSRLAAGRQVVIRFVP